ncbi:hypothetical protein MJT46_015369 [Ovis ammon polii x Ovis aries]|nr:hypothetical protein MJT46_015369 [Ovis ammon polii x Ovis aries]
MRKSMAVFCFVFWCFPFFLSEASGIQERVQNQRCSSRCWNHSDEQGKICGCVGREEHTVDERTMNKNTILCSGEEAVGPGGQQELSRSPREIPTVILRTERKRERQEMEIEKERDRFIMREDFEQLGAAPYLSPGSPDSSLIQESVPPSLRNQFHLRKPKTLLINQNYSSSVLNSLRNRAGFGDIRIFTLKVYQVFLYCFINRRLKRSFTQKKEFPQKGLSFLQGLSREPKTPYTKQLEQRQLFLDVAGRPSRGGAALSRSQGSPERSESVTVITGDPGAQGHDRSFALKPLHQQWCLVGTVRNPR